MNRYEAFNEIERARWEVSEQNRKMEARRAAAIASRTPASPGPSGKWPNEQQRAALHRFLAQAGTPGAPTVFHIAY